jgi:hypothetical protein
MREPLSDNQAHDRIKAAEAALGDEPGATQHADTALGVARKALRLIAMALVAAGVKAGD